MTMKNENQGHTREQVTFSEIVAGVCMVLLVILLIMAVVVLL